ncbi:MAG: hypothetical protein RLZZ574_103, partial [Cyanobacteriota bacterium]
LLSAESTDSVIISEIEVKNYLFAKHNKSFNNLVLSHDLVYLPKENTNSTNFVDIIINERSKPLNIKKQLKNQEQYFDFTYDILPFIISKPLKVTIDHLIETRDSGSNPTNLFAVVCTPRSGSSFLCDLLKLNDAGNPLEHLRSSLLYIIEHRQRLNIDLELLLRKILYKCSKNRLFGTKVISHFLFDLLVILDQDEIEKLMSFFRHFKIIYLYRDNKIAQAVSKFLASKSKFWHSTSPHRSLSEYQQQVQTIEYDFASIKEIYEKLVEEEQRLENLIDSSGFKEVIKIDYEFLKEDPEAEMKRVMNFLNIESKQINLQSDFKVLSSDRSEKLIAKFNQEYSSESSKQLQVKS